MNFAQKLPAYVIGGGLLIGAIVAIGLWYLALFALAGLLFLALWLVARSQHQDRRDVLIFRPGTTIPAEVWAKTEGLPLSASSQPIDISLVELDKYRDNWSSVRTSAQVDRPGNPRTRVSDRDQ